MNTDPCTDLIQCNLCGVFYYATGGAHYCNTIETTIKYTPTSNTSWTWTANPIESKLDRILQLLEELLGGGIK